MKKTLLMMILAVAGIVNVQAQGIKHSSKAPKKALTAMNATIEPEANQLWWGYTDADDEMTSVGTGVAESYNLAIYVPGTNPAVAGKTIKAIRFANYAKNIKYAKVWLANDLPGSVNKNNTVELVSLSNVEQGINEVALTEGHTIGSNGIYIGYTFTISKLETEEDKYPICISGDAMPNSFLMKTSRSFSEWSQFGDGRLFLQVLIEGEFPYQNAASPAGSEGAFIEVNKEGDVQMAITNLGSEPLSEIDYTIINKGVASAETHITLDKPLNYGFTAIKTIKVVGDEQPGSSERTIKFTKANGVDNEATTDGSANITINTLSKIVKPALVVEEFTGTGCGWCPRGLVGMEKMRKKYGSQFIGIGYHGYNSTDPMYLPSSRYTLPFSSAPSCDINRFYGIGTDPYYGTGSDVISNCEEQLTLPAIVAVDVKGEWNEDFTEIKATATIEGIADGEYKIEYMLIADSLIGPESSWLQSNYYNGQTGLPADLAFLANAGSSYSVVFNDVCLATSIEGGSNKATAPGKVGVGEIVTNTYTLKMPTKQILLNSIDREKVAVVAVLINNDGTVANAMKYYMVNTPEEKEELADGTYYFQNVATGKFLAAGHSWGTRSIVNETGLDFTAAKAEDGKYTLDSQVANNATSHFLGSNLFVDAAAYGWTIENVGDGIFTLSDGTQFLAVGDNNETALVAEAGEAAQWKVMTYADRLAELATATEAAPVNATFVIKDANFNRNDQ
ncbi:MAG: hypothetical protein K5683_11505, partial [Prevotella sp.]|nr:hypothetical protein [Prevotella sp.]